MKRTTVYLDATDYGRLKRLARQKGCSPAFLVREAVAAYARAHAAPVVPTSLGAFRSRRRDLSERAEDLLDKFGAT
jgi:hypothetical protein